MSGMSCIFHGGAGSPDTCDFCKMPQKPASEPAPKNKLVFKHDYVQSLRKSKGLTFEDIGNACGTTKQSAMGWVTSNEPRGSCLLLLSKLLGVDPWDLYEVHSGGRKEEAANNS